MSCRSDAPGLHANPTQTGMQTWWFASKTPIHPECKLGGGSPQTPFRNIERPTAAVYSAPLTERFASGCKPAGDDEGDDERIDVGASPHTPGTTLNIPFSRTTPRPPRRPRATGRDCEVCEKRSIVPIFLPGAGWECTLCGRQFPADPYATEESSRD